MKKRNDGRYERQITMPNGRRMRIYAKTPAELTKRVYDIQAAYEQGVEYDGNILFARWAEKYLITYKRKLRENTRASLLRNLNLHILPYIGHVPVNKIIEINCQDVMNGVAEYGDDLQRKVRNLLRQILDAAVTNHMIAFNPAAKLKITPHAKPKKTIETLTPEQQATLLKNVTEPRALAFCALGLYAGLRREEALGLLWSDINFTRRELHVCRSLAFPVNQPDENRELKTPASNRILPMPDALVEILKNTPRIGANVVTTPGGKEMTLSSFRCMWRHYVTSVVDFHVYPYLLRHSFASSMYRMGVDIKTTQRLMGHTDIETTLNIYTHLSEQDNDLSNKKIQAFSIV